MLTRRNLLLGAAAGLAWSPTQVSAFTDGMLGQDLDQGFEIPEELQARRVQISGGQQPGSVHVMSERKALYLILPDNEALRFPIAVGLAGRQFRGAAYVGRKEQWPSWQPTRNMIRREPEIYAQYANGVSGGPDNPLGARALYLYRNGRDTLYRIHGTSQPWSIGREGSSGCIRMFNSHVAFLYGQVRIGTPVVAH